MAAAKKKKKKKGNIFVKIVLGLVVILVAALGGIYWYYQQCLKPMSNASEEVAFSIPSGSSLQSVSYDLQDAGMVRNGKIAYYYAKFNGLNDIKAGDYTLDKSWDLTKIYTVLCDPNAAHQETVSVTLIEGDWAKDAAKKLGAATGLSAEDFLALWNDEDYVRSLMSEYPFLTEEIFNDNIRILLEGYLAPETYEFFADTDVKAVTEKILDQQLQLYSKYKDDIAASELSVHEIYTLASILQYEASTDLEDLKNVASVFYNRMAIGMPLQSSVTVCYAIDFDKDVDDWQACEFNSDFDSPYNTYAYLGLPPGPIENPGEDALVAALYPNDTPYYFFMADVYGDGKIYFAETLEEHNANVAKYLGG